MAIPPADLSTQMTALADMSAENREFQLAVQVNSIKMNGDNKIGQKAGDVGK